MIKEVAIFLLSFLLSNSSAFAAANDWRFVRVNPAGNGYYNFDLTTPGSPSLFILDSTGPSPKFITLGSGLVYIPGSPGSLTLDSTGMTISASQITQNSSNRFVSDAEKAIWNSKPKVFIGGTEKTGAIFIAKSATVSGGNVIFHLTANELSGGAALCPNGNVYGDAIDYRCDNELTGLCSFGAPASSNGNKTITIQVNRTTAVTSLPIIGAVAGLLGIPATAPNGTVIKATFICD